MSDLIKLDGRKTKLKKPLLDALSNVVNTPASVAYTDEEIVHLINEQLPEKQQISYTSFRNWKNGNYLPKRRDEQIYSEFLSLIKSLRSAQKAHHINAMLNDENAGTWQRRAWLLERKFPDLNLTQKVDHTSGGNALSNVRIVYPKQIEQAEDAEILESDND